MSSMMNFTKYNVLGFDMDFTLARYELVPFFNVSIFSTFGFEWLNITYYLLNV